MVTKTKSGRYLVKHRWVFTFSYKPGFFGGAQMWRDPVTNKLHAQRMAISIQRERNKATVENGQ